MHNNLIVPPAPDWSTWSFIDGIVASKVQLALEQQIKAQEDRKREWRKTWHPWIAVAVALLSAGGIWQAVFHIPETIKTEVNDQVTRQLNAKTADLHQIVADNKAEASVAAEIFRNARSDSENAKKLSEEGSKSLVEANKSLGAIALLLNSTAKTMSQLVDKEAWKTLQLPVGTVLFVDKATLKSVTGLDNAEWDDPKVRKDWTQLEWAVLAPGADYLGSTFANLPDDSVARQRVKTLTEAIESKGIESGVLVIRLNGPTP